jgi:uncharacterized membrane protein YedE/YeeE
VTEPNLAGGLIGGALIGLAAVLLLAVNGRIAGISGILAGLFENGDASLFRTKREASPFSERFWRLAFLLGLAAGAGGWALARGSFPMTMQAQGLSLIVAGLLVGAGTRIGAGCTSGHGICGLARRSPRSVAATLTFMATGLATVFVTRHVLT